MAGILSMKGVHPPEKKRFSSSKEIEDFPTPSEVFIPLQQHIGAPLDPIVEKGDEVKRGEKLADSEAFVSAPVHASIGGTVKGIEKILVPGGGKKDAVRISAGDDQELKRLDQWSEDKKKITAQEIRDLVREAGISGMGGAMFPTHVKLSVPEDKEIDHFILNGAECEPYLTIDHRIMVEKSHQVLRGFKLLMKAVDVENGTIAIEENKPDAISKMKETVSGEKNIEVEVLPAQYPQGGETVLIKTLLDREVPVGGLPLDVGVIVNNVATAAAVHSAVDEGRPMIDRPLTVTGHAAAEPANYIVPLGTLFSEVIEEAGGTSGELGKIVAGGPMLGRAQPSAEVPVVKGTSGILLLKKDEVEKYDPDPCIKCAKCVDVCPCDLMPTDLEKFARKEKLEKLEEYKVINCIECGSCSYICPSQRPLVHYIRLGKTKLNEQQNSESE